MRQNWFRQVTRALGIARPLPVPFTTWFDEAGAGRALPPSPFQKPAKRVYSEEQKAVVWQKGRPIIGWDPNHWRVDHKGNPLFRLDYGDPASSFGWEIGHIVDREKGGSDDLSNLRPQQCRRPDAVNARYSELLSADPFAR